MNNEHNNTQPLEQQDADLLWLDDAHASVNHHQKTRAVLQTLNADADIMGVYRAFEAYRRDPEQMEAIKADMDSSLHSTLDDLIKIHQADWLLKPKSNNPEGLRRLLFAIAIWISAVLRASLSCFLATAKAMCSGTV